MACPYTRPATKGYTSAARTAHQSRWQQHPSSQAAHRSKSGVAAGQPRVEKGHRPEENHVSSTSLSCARPVTQQRWALLPHPSTCRWQACVHSVNGRAKVSHSSMSRWQHAHMHGRWPQAKQPHRTTAPASAPPQRRTAPPPVAAPRPRSLPRCSARCCWLLPPPPRCQTRTCDVGPVRDGGGGHACCTKSY